MTLHLTSRLAWHDSGWNGHVCQVPAENTYCVGCHSYPGEMIAEGRKLEWEKQHAGKPMAGLDGIPPCIYSANAFGADRLRAYAEPPVFFNDDTETRIWDLPPASVCVWPYEEMYGQDLRSNGSRYDNDLRRERAKAFFEAFSENRSLIFYYANYSNPLSEDDAQRYVLVGLSRIREIGEELMYAGCSKETRERFGGGFVWDRTVTSHYPDQGLRLPYQHYRHQPDTLAKFAISPENPRTCKYGSKHLSDDDALGLVEQFLVAVEVLQSLGDKSEDWAVRKTWLQELVAELWHCRGLYPGFPAVLTVLKFDDAIPYFKAEVAAGHEKKAFDDVIQLIAGTLNAIPGITIDAGTRQKLARAWKLRGKEDQILLRDTLPRFDLKPEQIEAILSPERAENNIQATLAQIGENPYILAEQYIGNAPDDNIPWSRIDRGALPSPELGGNSLVDLDSPKRMRSLAVQCLQREGKHAFLLAGTITQQINSRIAVLPEYKCHTFTPQYWEVDAEFLAQALHLRMEDDRLYVYLASNYEDERLIEKTLKFLIGGPDIQLTRPVTEATWRDYLYEPESILAQKAAKEYGAAIEGQVEACQRVFVRPLTVLAGAAGTGKTTVIKSIIKAIKKGHGHGTSVIALAPTGKAADRIREILETDASLSGSAETVTIHSFLAKRGWLNDNMTLKRSGGKVEQGFLTYIVDEASMLDLGLAACLFRAIKWELVQRLIFVGDPNQLPPIGCGRVFADVVDHLNEKEPTSIATLRDNLRQLANRAASRGTAILELASCYVREAFQEEKDEEASVAAEQILRAVQAGGDVDRDLRVIYWNQPEELAALVIKQITADFEGETGNKLNPDRPYELWRAGFKDQPETSQILTPYRGELFGIEALNSAIQSFVGRSMLDRVGQLDGITLFDKVIQIRNRPKSDMAFAYVPKTKKSERLEIYNGELGFVKPHGFDNAKWKSPYFRLKHFQVVFGRKKDFWVNYGSELGKSDTDRWIAKQSVEENLELAYAISIHKAQGSEFERTYVIVPKSKTTLLSPELFYTALTRAKRHCTLFIEQDISALVNMRRREKSHLAQINSSVFAFRPVPEPLLNLGAWYEEGKIHETIVGCMVRSKSETIIANLLAASNIPFHYELPLFAPDGTFYLPDFTIEWRGNKFFWEHLGMLDKPKYKKHWEEKKVWYAKHFPSALLLTEESGKLSKMVQEIIERMFV